MYSRITAIMIRMRDDDRQDSIDSLMQSMMSNSSLLKSEQCRNKLSLLYLLFIGLEGRLDHKNSLTRKMEEFGTGGERANSYLTKTS